MEKKVFKKKTGSKPKEEKKSTPVEETKTISKSKLKEGKNKALKLVKDKDTIYFYGSKDPCYEFCNFYPSKFKVKAIEYKTSEHYFQSQKFPQEEEYSKLIREAKSPATAARLGRSRKYQLRQDWNEVKDNSCIIKVF